MRGACGAACLLHKVDIYEIELAVDTSYTCQPGVKRPLAINFFIKNDIGRYLKYVSSDFCERFFPNVL